MLSRLHTHKEKKSVVVKLLLHLHFWLSSRLRERDRRLSHPQGTKHRFTCLVLFDLTWLNTEAWSWESLEGFHSWFWKSSHWPDDVFVLTRHLWTEPDERSQTTQPVKLFVFRKLSRMWLSPWEQRFKGKQTSAALLKLHRFISVCFKLFMFINTTSCRLPSCLTPPVPRCFSLAVGNQRDHYPTKQKHV